jgi:glutamyl-tRNA synthetase/nondiscriminating glutamyl-tRNA synthetase
MRVRFAPSPSGQLHVGNARTALFNWLLARRAEGVFVLRIEDTDTERSSRESESAIIEDLRWMGLDWDEGPDLGGAYGPYRQSERLNLYSSYANELLESGQAYRCFCSPETLEAERRAALGARQPARYAGTCRDLPGTEVGRRLEQGEPAAVRFRVPSRGDVAFDDAIHGEVVFAIESIGDPIVLRSDGRPAYNFAVVIDDVLMQITHVVRGEDHLSNTPRQVLLYDALGFTMPTVAHVPMVLGPDQTPLSKRHGATSVAEFRSRGYLPEALVNYLALLGWSPGDGAELLHLEEMAERFSLDRVGASAGTFDEDKLAWVNRHYLRVAEARRVARLSLPYFTQLQFVSGPTEQGLEFLASVVPMAMGAVDRLAEIPVRVRFLFDFDPAQAVRRDDVVRVLAAPGARDVVDALAQELTQAPRLDRDRFRVVAAAVRRRTSCKGRHLFHPIRIALTAQSGGPELDLAIPAIDRGAELPVDAGVAPILGCRERAVAFAAALR